LSVKRNYSASFIVNSTKYWRGRTLCFKGNSAQLFYQDLKFKKLDWAVFDLDSTNFGRIDLCYDRELNSTDTDPHLFLENSYCDWLRCNFRRVRKLPSEEVLVNSLSASFLTEKPENDLVKLEFVYRLIQLINYIKSLKSSSKSVSIGDQTYQTFQFRVNHFLEFIEKPRNNHYQIRKLIEFLESLQDIRPILDYFSDGGFDVTLPI